ncbi:MAG: MBL fold metallo-hydrolase [Pseudomonadales bacterium]
MSSLAHGKIVRLSDRLRRITAPNPGLMTGAGTNTYILGNKEVAIVDPGPFDSSGSGSNSAMSSHIDTILDSVGDRIKWVVATHTHLDHSPAVAPIAKATGAQVVGMPPADSLFQDKTFQPDWAMQHDDVIAGDDFHLRAIHTPGHVGNHLCFLLEEEGVLLAGDHIMNGSTVVIVPPSGDMKAYIASLQLLETYPLLKIAPAHGELMAQPLETLRWLVEHRLAREAKVIKKLAVNPAVNLATLVTQVYDDVDVSLHDYAQLSLLAHLIKLEQELLAVSVGEGNKQQWQLL